MTRGQGLSCCSGNPLNHGVQGNSRSEGEGRDIFGILDLSLFLVMLLVLGDNERWCERSGESLAQILRPTLLLALKAATFITVKSRVPGRGITWGLEAP